MMLVAVTGADPGRGSRRRKMAFLALAEGATNIGLSVHVVTPTVQPLRDGRWPGWSWQGNSPHPSWRMQEVKVSPRHSVLFDAMYLADLRRYRYPYQRFIAQARSRGYMVFNALLPHKDGIYDWLAAHPDLQHYLPATWRLSDTHQVEQALSHYSRLWLKPVYGSGGRHMVYLENTGRQMWRLTGERFYGSRLDSLLEREDLFHWLLQLQRRRPYVLQEDIPLVCTSKGNRVDFRITLVRNQKGFWQVIAVTARTAAPQALLTNFHAGGQVRSLTLLHPDNFSWLESLGMGSKDLLDMRELGVAVANELAAHEPLLGILGLDVGRSQQGHWYVYDWNVRPGRDILTDEELVACMTTVAGYAYYLHRGLGRSRERTKITHTSYKISESAH